MSEIQPIKISCIICTYNRVDLLRRALDSVINQTLSERMYEIIVVDNNSEDNTKQIAKSYSKTHNNIRYVLERAQGLSHARNRGANEAIGQYIIYLDDDAKADRDWLRIAIECFENKAISPIAIGGPILPFYADPKPNWFKDEYEIRSWGKSARLLSPGESFSGSNMAFRKEILMHFGGFDSKLGVKGPVLSLGEDTIFFHSIWKSSALLPSTHCVARCP